VFCLSSGETSLYHATPSTRTRLNSIFLRKAGDATGPSPTFDISNNGRNGAAAYLLRGGIDITYVSIGYIYLPYYGVNHVVEIYGR
jgi:hypothetical protein